MDDNDDKEKNVPPPSVRSLFEAVERRHDGLFDDGKGNLKEHLNVSTTAGAARDNVESNAGNKGTLCRLETVEKKGGTAAKSARKPKIY